MKSETHKKYSIDLAGQMAACEMNYARLMRLLPELMDHNQEQFAVELVGESIIVQVDVTERCIYTTMLEIRQASEDTLKWVTAPCFSLRVYHDVQMTEVISFNNHRLLRPKYQYPNENMYQQDEKAQLNAFLGEWLKHCLRYGQALTAPFIYS